MTTISWNFEGKTALITGASRGIGLAAAELLASAGAEVYALSRSGEPSAQSPRSHVLTVDVTSTEKLTRAAEDAASNTGRIDICIANAGVGFVEDYVHTNPVEWSRVIDVNLLGVMRVWQAVLPYMGNDGLGGRLIANSSAAGVRGELGTATYSASKAAIAGLVQSLAVEYADRAITVNAVAPGEIDTLLNREGRQTVAARESKTAEELLHDLLTHHIPARRLGSADEVAGLIAFLASDEAAYMTGQTVVIDGGQLLV